MQLPRCRTMAIAAAVLVAVMSLRRHLSVMVHTLAASQLWSSLSHDSFLSYERDAFDVTFNQYTRMQPGSASSSLNDTGVKSNPTDVVPAMIHYISFTPEDELPMVLRTARRSCIALHPKSNGYEHLVWKAHAAYTFLNTHYPEFVDEWLSYRFEKQQMDSFRYFLLLHYGGIAIDNDVHCQRSFGPLRRFPIVHAVDEYGGGQLARGVMMAQPNHPFYQQVVQELTNYHLRWPLHPRTNVALTTGMDFLSVQHFEFPLHARTESLKLIPDSSRLYRKVVSRHVHRSHYSISDYHIISTSSHVDMIRALFFLSGAVVIIYAILTGFFDWNGRSTMSINRKRKPVTGHRGIATDESGAVWIRISEGESNTDEVGEGLPEYTA